MIFQNLFYISLVLQSYSKTYLVKSKIGQVSNKMTEDDMCSSNNCRFSNDSIGYDYMKAVESGEDDKMVEEKVQSVRIGGSAALKCTSASRIITCYYYRPDGNVRIRSKHGVTFESDRYGCLCDVSK